MSSLHPTEVILEDHGLAFARADGGARVRIGNALEAAPRDAVAVHAAESVPGEHIRDQVGRELGGAAGFSKVEFVDLVVREGPTPSGLAGVADRILQAM